MKKIASFLLLAFFLVSCASIPIPLPVPFVSTQTFTPEPTEPSTSTPEPTATPVLPTSTFTLTPTLVGLKTPTPTMLLADTPSPLMFVPNTLVPMVEMKGFASVTASLSEIYKARGCQPSAVRITTIVSNSANVEYVLLFARFKSLIAERASKWTVIQMVSLGGGTYIHDLSSDQMLEDAYFETSWIEYQLVSTDKDGDELGRTDIFKERLKMLECRPSATPTSANVNP